MPRNRSLPPHLEIRRTGYTWRRRLPRSLRDRGDADPSFGDNENRSSSRKSFLCFSLRTHVPADAKTLTRRLTEMSDLVFAAEAETMMAIAPEIQVQLLEGLARFEIAAFEQARAVAGPRSSEAAALDLRREEALQATLRKALWHGDREVARNPLRHVAVQLGIDLDEADADWTALAYEATKVLLDVSQERARRQQGFYDQPTMVFRRPVSTADPVAVAHRTGSTDITVAPASFATCEAASAPLVSAPTSMATGTKEVAPKISPAAATPPAPERSEDATSQEERPACGSSLRNSTPLSAPPAPTVRRANSRCAG